MVQPSWLDYVREECVRRRLPPSYVERLLTELSDHLADFQENRMSKDAHDLHRLERHLGAPHVVADSAAREYRRARFSGRHPVLTFVVLPLLVAPLLTATAAFALLILANVLGLAGEEARQRTSGDWEQKTMSLISQAVVLLPVVMTAIGCCWLAARSAVSWKWIAAACLLVALLGGTAMVNLALPGNGHQGSLTFGLGLSAHPSLGQLLQFALPLTIGAWTIWRQSQVHRRLLAG